MLLGATMNKFALLVLLAAVSCAWGASKTKPHGHTGVLEPYSGKPLPVHLTSDQKSKLESGEAVVYNERDGKSGYGVVIQDINATQQVCLSKICDLKNYCKVVPHVKSVDIYEQNKFANGSSKTGAKFDIGLMGMTFGYFLLVKHEPKYNTLTWTLDYRYNSDFDDNVGHWQVMPHPSRDGWTRILYSCKVKLFNWIPEFVIRFLTSKALIEATGWVKKESEEEQRRLASVPSRDSSTTGTTSASRGLKLPSWLNIKGGSGGSGDSEGPSLESLQAQVDARLDKVGRDVAEQRSRFGVFGRLRMPAGKFGRL